MKKHPQISNIYSWCGEGNCTSPLVQRCIKQKLTSFIRLSFSSLPCSTSSTPSSSSTASTVPLSLSLPRSSQCSGQNGRGLQRDPRGLGLFWSCPRTDCEGVQVDRSYSFSQRLSPCSIRCHSDNYTRIADFATNSVVTLFSQGRGAAWPTSNFSRVSQLYHRTALPGPAVIRMVMMIIMEIMIQIMKNFFEDNLWLAKLAISKVRTG